MTPQLKRSEVKTKFKMPAHPKALPLAGSLQQARHDPLGFALNLTRKYGDIIRFRIGFYKGYLLNHPDYFKHVLQSNFRNYSKNNYNYKKLKPVLGEGLITGDGDLWQQQRHLIQPLFHHQQMDSLAFLTKEMTQEMLSYWHTLAAGGQSVNIVTEVMHLTLRIVTRALFSIDISAATHTIEKNFTILNQDISNRFQSLFTIPLWIPSPKNLTFKKARACLNREVNKIISLRRIENRHSDDLLDMLLTVKDETSGKGISDDQIRDEVMTLMLAGHETTANLITWTCYLLSQYPDVMWKLRTELNTVLGSKPPETEDLAKLVYTKNVLQESLRLYPPVWIISRRAINDDVIGGYHIPKGTTVTLCSYTLHRHPDFWPHPEVFNPDRFSDNQDTGQNRNAYFPFGGGPRSCIGRHFAMTEAQIILVMILQHFNLQLLPGQTVNAEALVTLRPRNGLKMILKPVEIQN